MKCTLSQETIALYNLCQMLVRLWNKRNSHSLLVGVYNGTTTLEQFGNFL